MSLMNLLGKNKGLKNLFIKQFKDYAKENNIRHIFISIQDDGEYDIVFHKENMRCIEKEKLDALIREILSNKLKENIDGNQPDISNSNS